MGRKRWLGLALSLIAACTPTPSPATTADPAAFVATYGQYADAAAAASRLSRWTILAQWATETGWGTSFVALEYKNLAGIRYRDADGVYHYRQYGTYDDFVAGWLSVINLSYYSAVRASAVAVYDSLNAKVEAESKALGESPWAGSHYAYGGVRGGLLINVWAFYLRPLVPPEPYGLGALTPSPEVPALERDAPSRY